MVPIGYQPLIDCQVPNLHNYQAAGVYHHNCGKTLAIGAELAFHLTGLYAPWWVGRRWDRPIVAWAAGETAETTRDNPQRVLVGMPSQEGTGMIPRKHLALTPGEYGKVSGVADLYDFIKVRHHDSQGVEDGWSFLRLKYYAQGAAKWQGPPVDFVWFDEEPPSDVYSEGMARITATAGMVALSFTPLLGMSDVVKRYLMEPSEDRAEVNMTIEDAQHIKPEDRAKIIAGYAEHERDARARGIPIMGSGLVFPIAESIIKVPAFDLPAYWPRLAAMDFGSDHPTACVWLAHDRDADVVYVYDAYRRSGRPTPVPVPIHASAIKSRGAWIPVAWPHDGNNETAAGPQLAKQYRAEGVLMRPENAKFALDPQDPKRNPISVEAGLSEMWTRMQTGRLKVFGHLEDWMQEFRLYHRDKGLIVKIMDDLLSATRYGIMDLRFATVRQTRIPTVEWQRPFDEEIGI